ncbi:MAG: hypothetical protein D6730_07280 [Bacteroidetes bacterium]|nr:MAG: hypothetical protein D6730_07280 [Bacteroidota bacterium]
MIRAIFSETEIPNTRTVLQIPYESERGEKIYKCENDLIISPHAHVRSDRNHIDPDEIVISVKTSSKDRMGKMFMDKMLLESFTGRKQKIIGIFQNDVQRKQHHKISYTFVSGLFLVYTKFLVELEGIYYLDLPPIAQQPPYNRYIKPFSKLMTEDIWKLLGP